MSGHADLAPSSASRWLTCYASVRASEGFSRDDDEWNIEGTVAHQKLEHWLLLGLPPTDGILYEQLEHAFLYAVNLERRGYEVSFERKVKYNEIVWGTVDILGIRGNDVAVGDYKHGYRSVEIKNNAQTSTYGVCAQKTFNRKFNTVSLTVIQPRMPHIDGPVRTWNTDGAYLAWHAEQIEFAIRQIDKEDAPFIAGKHCKFCALEGNCRTYANWVIKNATGAQYHAA